MRLLAPWCAVLLLAAPALAQTPPPADAPVAQAPATPEGAALLAKALELLEVPDFAGARDALEQALVAPGNDRSTLLQAYELLGFIAASMRDPERALQHFTQLLVLDPGYQRTRDYSPRVTAPFLEARAWVADHGSLKFVPMPPSGRTPLAGALVVSDPLKLARAVRFHLRQPLGGAWAVQGVPLDGQRATTPLPAGGAWWAELLGEHEAVLSRIGSPEKPLDGAGDALRIARRRPGPAPVQWAGIGAAGAGVAAIAVGAFFGLEAQANWQRITGAARDESGRVVGITQREAYAYDARARSAALVADVLMVSGVALIGGGGALYFWGGPGGAGAGVGGKLP